MRRCGITLSRFKTFASILATLGLLGTTAQLIGRNIALKHTIEKVQAAQTSSLALTSLLPIIATHSRAIDQERARQTRPLWYLVFFSSDRCKISAANLKNWTALIDRLRPAGVEVWFLSLENGNLTKELCQRATARGFGVRELTIPNAFEFVIYTGIEGTPATLLLNADGAVELSQSGELDTDTVSQFAAPLDGVSFGKRSRPFLKNRPMTEVLNLPERTSSEVSAK